MKLLNRFISNLLFVCVAYFSYMLGLILIFDAIIPPNKVTEFLFISLIVIFLIWLLNESHKIDHEIVNELKFSIFMERDK